MARPEAMPKLVTMGAEQSWRRRTMMWQGTAIKSSRTLPFRSQERSRVTTAEEFRKIEIEENSPEQPEDKAEAPDISFRGKVRVPKLIARDADAERKDSGGGENGHEKSGDCAGNENVGAGLEAFERGIDGEKKQEGLARKKDAERDPD